MTGPDPRVAAVRTAVARAVGDLPAGALVLVACSGGADSLALAAGAAFVAGRSAQRGSAGRGSAGRGSAGRGSRPLRAGAVVVDHGLQAGSADVAARAAAACRDLGLDPVLVERVDVGSAGGPEAAARTARYDALERAARRVGAAAVLLGHTLDDQAETVLLGLARGSGARSLAGMPAARGVLRRPLLGLRRADTLGACAAQGLVPWADPTNAGTHDAAPLRSRVRDRVLPVLERELGPGVAAALARTADQLREDADALDALATALVAAATLPPSSRPDPPTPAPPGGRGDVAPGSSGAVHELDGSARAARRAQGGDGCVELDVDVLRAAGDALRRRALRIAAVRAGCPAGDLHRVHVLAVDALLTGWHGQGPVDLPGGVTAVRACGRLSLGPAGPRDDGRQER